MLHSPYPGPDGDRRQLRHPAQSAGDADRAGLPLHRLSPDGDRFARPISSRCATWRSDHADVPLRELAQVIRSKNAGPFELTFDIIFDRKAAYEEVKTSGALTAEKLARLYNIPVEDVLVAMFFDAAMAFKMTVKPPLGSRAPAASATRSVPRSTRR